jgi:alkylation response protein AidB-like acyl-CoA dehydrogenase
MDFELPPEAIAVADVAKQIANDVLRPRARKRDQMETFPMEEARILAENGLMGVAVSPEYGGLGAGKLGYAAAIREIAGACASTAVTMAVTNMVAEMIEVFGTDVQKETVIENMIRGDVPVGSFCLSEAQSGSDAVALRTKAERRGDVYVLNGTKMWVTSGSHCAVALIMARTDPEQRSRGITAFLVDPGTPGFSVAKAEDKMGLRGSKTVSISLEDCEVSAANILGGEGAGFKVAMTALDGGRIGIGAQALGIARSALQVAVRAVKARPEKQSQAEKFRLADAAVALESGWLMVLRAAYLKQTGARMTREAAMAKVYATEAAGRVAELALTTVGGLGLRAEHDVERYLRDVRVTRIYEGTSEIQRHVIARELIRGAA